MAKTFNTLDDKTYEADDVEYLSVDTDIVSDEVSGYFAYIGDYKLEVSKQVYEALKNYKKF
ncbi:hypothetical protein QTJ04_07850 [Clostridium perfringens]|uniref:hypothetical protein n=1 Tax=Clostridium perfringens TaxID=1502 RepID=UPI00103FA6EA|nr:hypothetical protein [Clostridium perfringens]MDM1006168.1 hypothetical protein [Clostridium perfringens]MDU1966875.1 hypothetical protein [Clostridium perfringens]TBX13102.1 hypothetical protein BFS03_07615 [Clostridium perfringens]